MEYSSPLPYNHYVLDPLFDVGFKLIFGRENVSEPLLVHLLNSIFAGDPEFGNIISVTFKNTEYPNEWVKGKGIRYDIRCETADHRHFIVEMQKGEQEHFVERCCYYVSRAVAAQGYRGKDEETGKEWDFSLEPVIGVFFCNFHVRGLAPEPVVKGRILDEATWRPIGDVTRYVYIQIPFFNQLEEECTTQLEKWIFNIKNMGRTQRIAYTMEDTFNYLKSVSDVATLPPDEREVYEAELMKARDYYAIMKTAKKKAAAEGRAEGIAEGRAEGIAEGRAEGLEKGIAEGREQGIAEGKVEGRAEGLAEGLAEGEANEKARIGRRMLQKGMDPESVADITGLSLEEISKLN